VAYTSVVATRERLLRATLHVDRARRGGSGALHPQSAL